MHFLLLSSSVNHIYSSTMPVSREGDTNPYSHLLFSSMVCMRKGTSPEGAAQMMAPGCSQPQKPPCDLRFISGMKLGQQNLND